MKKIVLSVVTLLTFGALSSMAQVNATFKVDITPLLAGGGTINNVVSIAGNFTSRGGNLADWTPAQGAMTDMGNNVWSRDVTFDGTATDSLQWKYVQGSDWPDGDEGNEWVNPDPSCVRVTDNNNRKILLPTAGDIIVTSGWAECQQIINSVKVEYRGLFVTVGPNPASTNLSIRFVGTTNAEVKLTDLTGRVVKSFTGQEVTENIDVTNLTAGLYYVTVVDGDKGYQAPVIITK
ncbi:MAG TPA: T9SS type A sorting domain-containing protein [Catalimonadaceae bacterium]|nr:T9SS type A sorting domain-containing protein [Catalimonadaceae bacterium]HPI09563.1 T9SS type A sorting domain-containing protein [Catalimonadaceae bacterium]